MTPTTSSPLGTGVSSSVPEGTTPVDHESIRACEQEMTETVIPKIVSIMERRAAAAAISRQRFIA